MSYAERLQKAMRDAGVTTSALASELGVSYQAIKKVVDGKAECFTLTNHLAACKFLKVDVWWLATGEAKGGDFTSLAANLAREFDSIPEPAARRIAYSMCMAAINQATHPDIGEHAPGREPSEQPEHDPETPPEEDRAEPRTKHAAATKAGGPQS